MSGEKTADSRLASKSMWDVLASAPVAFGFVGVAIGGLGYGLYNMVNGSMRQQSKGMTTRISFQLIAIVAVAVTLGTSQQLKWQDDNKKRHEIEQLIKEHKHEYHNEHPHPKNHLQSNAKTEM
eukprot:TRINITY_DN24411_c0_g1_i1.p1 TRINITY_DN24411_c0_g1~~TRINITY_DN24411_c0_g1_i1.p1  ORF type:complete len:123 (-),score=14.60 TRINITY_DN24411_c0_g1_i1:46-414(-)